jgi:hypothetical protein
VDSRRDKPITFDFWLFLAHRSRRRAEARGSPDEAFTPAHPGLGRIGHLAAGPFDGNPPEQGLYAGRGDDSAQ